MDDEMAENDMVIGLDLNQSPPSFSDELQTSRGGIENRIRQLEAVTTRANQRQRWRQVVNDPELSYATAINPIVGLRNENRFQNGIMEIPMIGGGEQLRNCKRDISQVAKALEMDLDDKKTDEFGASDGVGVNGNFYDCNICLEMAKDPILTCCGHLFCWSCFYQVPYVDSISRECPACKGEVIDANITPIYGNGKNSQVLELESGLKIPPRPKARRKEGVRQQSFGRGISHNPGVDALRRIRIGLGLIGENNSHNNLVIPNNVVIPSEESHQFSRVASDTASFSSISSAINSAERFVEDLETYISVANTNINIQLEPQNAEMNLSSGSRRNVATTVLHMGNLGNVEIDLTISHPNSSTSRRGIQSIEEGEPNLEFRRQLS